MGQGGGIFLRDFPFLVELLGRPFAWLVLVDGLLNYLLKRKAIRPFLSVAYALAPAGQFRNFEALCMGCLIVRQILFSKFLLIV